ncbi:hypothetical protein PPL_07473 [Heterostelium album PN500]|uniref:Uncharacterized protein n=1 Tax=Heterostelium pallidum (strain ATCC 26659 / Pp 5 / PN500) TaxID=670386 RepID=D3BG22_HETP5|nr:hypothetical protein PPL_07473 [Heterostelium album PN500]EFA79614.1 hypothetical protein PPL_07473 [Heterostelium album PN500]|eukprot:XP_020431735.1 hypothetical protein PPL_07473 [Heterostelium album PN500]
MASLKFDSDDFYYKILNNDNENESTDQEQIIQNDDKHLEKNTISVVSTCILSDILLERIIPYSLESKSYYNTIIIDSKSVLIIALVSKKFFKIVSKILTNSYYEWHGHINLDSEYSLIKSPPLFFDYESIKYIRYGWSTDLINQIFSGVELFHIKSDEYDCNTEYDGIRREYFRDETLSEYDVAFYRDTVDCDERFVCLPAMPNLKSIVVEGYYGYTTNYCTFLKSILKRTPNGDGHGIEQFKIDINKDSQYNVPEHAYINILVPLLRLHSNTLKSIEIRHIRRSHFEDMVVLIQMLKDLIPAMEQHSYSFKFYADYQKLKRACRDEQDRKVYQYLFNQKIKNNVIVDDIDDYDDNYYCAKEVDHNN